MGGALASAAAASVAGALATLALVIAEWRAGDLGRWVAKPVAAASFVAVPLLGGAALGGGPDRRYATLVLVGLVLGAGGDLALMRRGRPAFVAGIALFLAGHLAYVGAALALAGPAAWLGLHAVAPALVVAGALAWLWPYLRTSPEHRRSARRSDPRAELGGPGAPAPRPLVVAYLAVIALMLLAATSPLAAGATDARPVLLAAGAALFVASDLAVARQRFVAPDRWNKVVGLPLYVAAQHLVAWSTLA